MRILKFTPNPKPTIAILIKETDVEEMKKMTYLTQYLQKLASMGLDKPGENIVVLGLEYPKSGNIKKDTIVKCSNEILDYCSTQGIDTLYVADAKYYPYLSGNKKTEEFIGEVCKCSIEGYEDITVMPGLHHIILSFNPSKFETFIKGLSTLAKHKNGTLGVKSEVTIEEFYPRTVDDVYSHLDRLEKSDKLSIDIETRGTDKGDALRYDRGELSTIAISDTTSSGVAFPADRYWVGNTENEQKIRKRLKQFLITVLSDNNKKVYLHNGLFDAKFMIYNLFMDSDTDYEGMYEGIRLFSNMHDTMIMVYLCTNSTIKTDKGLKDVAREFIGNYAIDVKDITQHDLDTVLKYNLKDTCATMWVAEKYEDMLLDEDQHNVYLDIFRPSFGFLLEMMMTGLPVSLERTAEVKSEFQELMDTSLELIKSSHHVHRTIAVLKYNAMLKYNETHKKQKTEEDFSDIEFNPGSTLQMRILLFDILGLQIKDKTETGMPAVGGEILKEYKAEAEYNGDTDVVSLIGAILDYGKAAKMLGTFIKAIEELSSELSNGEAYLRGNLKLGGTQSGRLSASDPNLQNLPSGGKEGKLIKSCFVAPNGWLFCGSDFSALEDRIGAILSKDVNKTLEFSKNLDGHSLRALAFFPEELPVIDLNDIAGVNSIKDEYPDIRQKAKAPSFALQYNGTWVTIKRTLGCSEAKAKQIEENYHKLYPGLAAFSKANAQFGGKNGYVRCAFGLKLRTPLLKAKYDGTYVDDTRAEAEARSSSNATTQSYGMLMNRALIAFRNTVEASEYRHKIRFINTIHDAGYFMVKNEPEVIKFINDELIKEMQWQDDEYLQSNEVKLGAELDIGKSWDKQFTLKNNVDLETIKEFLDEHQLADK